MLVNTNNSEEMIVSPGGSTSASASDGEDSKGRVFVCTMCSYRTDRKNNLKRHNLTMHEMSPALLECCGFRFLNKAELRMHTQKFHRDGYHCTVCSRVFCRKALLKRHYSVHSGYKEFSCRHCSYETSHKSNLERHMRVHQKNGGPLPRHLLDSGYLPELHQQSPPFPPTMALHNPLLPAQPFQLYTDHHTGQLLYPTPKNAPSPWTIFPALPPPPPPPPPPLPTTLPQHHPYTSQAAYLPSQNPHTHYFKQARLSPRRSGPSHNFSVSALLGEDHQKRERDMSALEPVAPSAAHVHGSSSKAVIPESCAPTITSHGNIPSTHAYTSSGVVRPTPVHARSPSFALDLTRASSSTDMQACVCEYYCHQAAPVPSLSLHLSPRPPVPVNTLPHTFSTPSTGSGSPTPPLAQNPQRDLHYASEASSGYGSSEVVESPRCREEDHPPQQDQKCVQNLKPHLQHHLPPEHMEVDQQYVPKKLRASKKFKDLQKQSGEGV
ncbi:zinc finger protein 628-like [Homarus americanus]|uniref:zinc finger protein 628-like n=1 Tax=Homarus americanus TaxID=6706 RepID=UPI001C436F5D|nr:zinc finger protein 628-like [Homarus americanus]